MRREIETVFKVRMVGWKKCREFKIMKKLEGDKSFESFRKDRRIRHKSIVLAKSQRRAGRRFQEKDQ